MAYNQSIMYDKKKNSAVLQYLMNRSDHKIFRKNKTEFEAEQLATIIIVYKMYSYHAIIWLTLRRQHPIADTEPAIILHYMTVP